MRVATLYLNGRRGPSRATEVQRNLDGGGDGDARRGREAGGGDRGGERGGDRGDVAAFTDVERRPRGTGRRPRSAGGGWSERAGMRRASEVRGAERPRARGSERRSTSCAADSPTGWATAGARKSNGLVLLPGSEFRRARHDLVKRWAAELAAYKPAKLAPSNHRAAGSQCPMAVPLSHRIEVTH